MSHYDQRLGATFKPKVPKLLWRLSNWAPTPFPRPQQLPWPRADCPPPPRVCHPREPSESSLCPLETEILIKAAASSTEPPTPLEGEGPGRHPVLQALHMGLSLRGVQPNCKTISTHRDTREVLSFCRRWGVGGCRQGPPGPRSPPHPAQGPPIIPGELRSVSAHTEHRPCPTWMGTVLPTGPEESHCHYSHGSSERQVENRSQREARALPARPVLPTSETNQHSQVGFPGRRAAHILIDPSSHRYQPSHL